MRSDCDRGLTSVFSDFRKPSLRRELRFCLSLRYSEIFATSAERRLGWSGTASLARPDVTSSVEDLIDEGGETSVLDGETVDKEIYWINILFSGKVNSVCNNDSSCRTEQESTVYHRLPSLPQMNLWLRLYYF